MGAAGADALRVARAAALHQGGDHVFTGDRECHSVPEPGRLSVDLLPHDFPPSSTVYDYFAAWRDDGTDREIHDMLRRRVRRAAGREEEPTAICIDSQSVDGAFSTQGETVGFDGNNYPGRAVLTPRLRACSSAQYPGCPGRDNHGAEDRGHSLGDRADRRSAVLVSTGSPCSQTAERGFLHAYRGYLGKPLENRQHLGLCLASPHAVLVDRGVHPQNQHNRAPGIIAVMRVPA